jgi:[ribosomal protein S18]-alanine N-acetyltransferase
MVDEALPFAPGPDEGPPASSRPEEILSAMRIMPLRRRHLRPVVRIEEAVYPRPWTPALFLSEISQRASRRYTVAVFGPWVVGYCGLMIVGDEGHVTTLTVDPRWQGRGIGTSMLLDLARAAPPLGVHHLTLEVRVGNATAQVLYRRFGFAPVGVRKNYYAETGEDAIVMWARDINMVAYSERLAGIESQLRSRATGEET